ncbi:hypothetical protein ACHAW6_004624, partial [Cyclotella cf. meneghiniana]
HSPPEPSPMQLTRSESTITTVSSLSTASTLSVAAASYAGISNANDDILSMRKQLTLPPIGVGAWAWGDSVFWGYDRRNDDELKEVFEYALSKKLAFFDSAELYGLGRSEELLGKFRAQCQTKEEEDTVIIASKFAALPWRTKSDDVVKACKASMKRLGALSPTDYVALRGNPIDLYQIHFPGSWSNEEYWDGIADAYDQGLVNAVGVSNYGVDALRACHAKLSRRGIKLATNQIQMSLLYRWPIANGLLDVCKELDVKVLSYSPLALGFLTGKYNKSNHPSGPRSKIAEQLFKDDAFEQLMTTMTEISKRHNAAASQVALNWAISKGTIPIPGARNLKQVGQNLSCLDWSLDADEMKSLDEASSKVTGFITPDKNPFPRKDINTGLKMYDS